MTAIADRPFPGSGAPDWPPSDLEPAQAIVDRATEVDGRSFTGAELVDRMVWIERLRNSVEALQSETTRAFALAQAADETANGTVEPERLDRSIGAQVGLACGVSAHEGRKRVHVARDLHLGLDHVRRLSAAGRLSGYKVSTIVTVTADLDAGERAEVDRLLSAYSLEGFGVGRLRDLTRMLAAQVAPEKFRARCAAARSSRRVTLRSAADGMADLIAHLPAEQGAACYAALQKAVNEAYVNPAPLTRGRGQVMADTLVERITGQTTAEHVNIQVQVVVPVDALVDEHSPLPAEIPGHGPVPVDLIATTRGRKAWRKLVTSDGVVIGGDSQQRTFTGFLADLIRARDRHRCAEPHCDSPIRQVDHIVRDADGGQTEFVNGRGVCEFHNYLREYPGWNVDHTPDGLRTTTPTGHSYLSRPARRRHD